MRMQDVIEKLRERVPVIVDEWEQLSERLELVLDLAKDLKKAETGEAKAVLTSAIVSHVDHMGWWRDELARSLGELVELNASYKEKIGPRKRVNVEPDQFEQPDLPGVMEETEGTEAKEKDGEAN